MTVTGKAITVIAPQKNIGHAIARPAARGSTKPYRAATMRTMNTTTGVS